MAQTAHGSAEAAPVAAVAERLQVADALAVAISASVVVAHFALVAFAELGCAVAHAATAPAVVPPRVAAVATESSVAAQLHVFSALFSVDVGQHLCAPPIIETSNALLEFPNAWNSAFVLLGD